MDQSPLTRPHEAANVRRHGGGGGGGGGGAGRRSGMMSRTVGMIRRTRCLVSFPQRGWIVERGGDLIASIYIITNIIVIIAKIISWIRHWHGCPSLWWKWAMNPFGDLRAPFADPMGVRRSALTDWNWFRHPSRQICSIMWSLCCCCGCCCRCCRRCWFGLYPSPGPNYARVHGGVQHGRVEAVEVDGFGCGCG